MATACKYLSPLSVDKYYLCNLLYMTVTCYQNKWFDNILFSSHIGTNKKKTEKKKQTSCLDINILKTIFK